MKKNILIVGVDDFNMSMLSSLDSQESYNFVPIFNAPEIRRLNHINIEKMIDEVEQKMSEVGDIDAIISFFNFPFTLIAINLAQKYGLRTPTPKSALRCQHKYWSRIEQKKVVPDHVPSFTAINPYDAPILKQIDLDAPFWLKPIKAHSSELSFWITNEEELQHAYPKIQQHIKHFAEPFNYFLSSIDLPEKIKGIDGHHCIAEKNIHGFQCTLSGYVQDQQVFCYGLVDSVHYDEAPSFFYYYLPSDLPQAVQQRMQEIAKTIMLHIGFDFSPFNIEFFYNQEEDSIHILEINPRMSQSHADLYHKVAGVSNHQVLIDVAMGEKPVMEKRGKYNCAAKFLMRVFEDGVVKRVPTEEQIKKIEQKYPDTRIQISVKEGQQLSQLKLQDSFSYSLGIVYTGAQSRYELLEKYEKIKDELNIRIS